MATLIQMQDSVVKAAVEGKREELRIAKARLAKWCKTSKCDFVTVLHDALDMAELIKAAA